MIRSVRSMAKYRVSWKLLRTCFLGMALAIFFALVFVLAVMQSGSQHFKMRLCIESDNKSQKAEVLLLGHPRNEKGFLTIGISSVHRNKSNYLLRTLRSLVNRSTIKQQENVTIVLFLADFNSTLRQETANEVFEQFYTEILSGFLHIIQAPAEIYPPLTNLRRTYGDNPKRVTWRGKQAVDYSFLFDYSKNLSEYFILLEDDLICSEMYLMTIENRIRIESSRDWLAIHFTEFLVIGMTFKSTFLTDLSRFLRMFYAVQPVDFLILEFFKMLVPEKDSILHHTPSIFQHMGYFSSLDGKVQTLKDESFQEFQY